MNVVGVLLAAGAGTRTKLSEPKQMIRIGNKTLFQYTLDVLVKSHPYTKILLVVSKKTRKDITEIVERSYRTYPIHILLGGMSRKKSIQNAIRYVSSEEVPCDLILFQDAARPLVEGKDYTQVIYQSSKSDGAILAEPLRGLAVSIRGQRIKEVTMESRYVTTMPECYKFKVIEQLYRSPKVKNNYTLTNLELMLLHKRNVHLVLSRKLNLKVTFPEDVTLIESLLT
jgi:2-C-methyl-D-erythritol 4-phosphate cytidylyltransferase